MSISKLGALITADPEGASTKILAAMHAVRCDRKAAAAALGTTHRSLYRYIDRLNLWERIDEMIKANGFPKIPGPPRSRSKIREAVIAAGGNLARAARSLDMDRDDIEAKLSSLSMWAELNTELVARGKPAMRVPETAAPAAS